MRRVAITGLGAITPLGSDVPTFWRGLREGRSGVRALDRFANEQLRTDCAATVEDFPTDHLLDPRMRQLQGRVTLMLLAAAHEALGQAELPKEAKSRTGVLLGTGQGPVDVLDAHYERVAQRGFRATSPFFIPSAMPNAASALLSIDQELRGPSFTLASACATGAHAISTGALFIATGEADAMVVGGGEAAILPGCLAGFGNARALARSYEGDPARASRPFDKARSGFVIGEGAGALVLEAEELARERGAKILGWVVGWGASSDAEHIARPHSEGLGLRLAVERALSRAQIAASEIGYINPHATSTPQGDIAEYLALKAALGDALARTPISATKSMIGHLLGGASAVESVATVCSLRDGLAHPSINIDDRDPVFDLDLVEGGPRSIDARYALKTSAGFGGHNAALVFERAEA